MGTTATGSTLRLTAPFLPVGAALFCVQLDFFSLTLALPTIADDLGTTVTDLQWLLSGYMIALGSLLIPAGRAGDVLGRRTVLLLGVGLFGLTSLVCGLVSSVPVLIAARIAQGAGAAMIMPTAFALVTNATSEEIRPRVTGALLGIAGVGTALGPVVGGVLASTAGWRWVPAGVDRCVARPASGDVIPAKDVRRPATSQPLWAFASSIQVWHSFSESPRTEPCLDSIICLRLAALRWRNSLIESTPTLFRISA
nr:MFS transporter [Pseudonocardia xinjiangensis]